LGKNVAQSREGKCGGGNGQRVPYGGGARPQYAGGGILESTWSIAKLFLSKRGEDRGEELTVEPKPTEKGGGGFRRGSGTTLQVKWGDGHGGAGGGGGPTFLAGREKGKRDGVNTTMSFESGTKTVGKTGTILNGRAGGGGEKSCGSGPAKNKNATTPAPAVGGAGPRKVWRNKRGVPLRNTVPRFYRPNHG